MSYFRHVAACNPPVDEVFLPWRIDGAVVGWIFNNEIEGYRIK